MLVNMFSVRYDLCSRMIKTNRIHGVIQLYCLLRWFNDYDQYMLEQFTVLQSLIIQLNNARKNFYHYHSFVEMPRSQKSEFENAYYIMSYNLYEIIKQVRYNICYLFNIYIIAFLSEIITP